MDWNLFIIPVTMIAVELLKRAGVPTKWLPHMAVLLGALGGAGYAANYGGDYFQLIFSGAIYGASSAGIYDVGKSTLKKEANMN